MNTAGGATASGNGRILDGNDPSAIAAAVAALKRGALVAMPTETVYGLAADAGNPQAVGAIFLAKGRPRFNPLIVHVASADAARAIGIFNDAAARLAAAFWPGPLTLVVPRRAGAPIADLATAGLATVALRVPAHPVAQALLAAFGGPLTAPSANRSGHVSATLAAHVAADLGERVSVILDAGASPIGVESTIVGFSGETATLPIPMLLRAGGVPREAIEAVLGAPLAVAAIAADNRPMAPGMLASHYAPAARLRLDATSVNPGEALLAFGSAVLPGAAVATVNLSARGDLAEAAAGFFAALRTLDAAADVIAVAPIPAEGLGEAINDRLMRAAAPRG
jgi:L-threonylcarbamoyladenylate synthase